MAQQGAQIGAGAQTPHRKPLTSHKEPLQGQLGELKAKAEQQHGQQSQGQGPGNPSAPGPGRVFAQQADPDKQQGGPHLQNSAQ